MSAPAEVAPREERRRRWHRGGTPAQSGAATPEQGADDGAPATSSTPPPAREWPRTTWLAAATLRHGATILHVLSLVGAFAILLVVDKHMWFRVDDFEFLAKRGLHGATNSIWAPHNEHWSTLPILAYRALFTIFGLRTSKPYLILVFAAHLTLAHVLWRAMRTAGARPGVATALAAVFALLGAGASDILWAFQIGYVGSVLLGWVFLLLENHDRRPGWRDALAFVVAVGALMTSGVAVSMIVVGGLVALARRGWRAAAIAVVPPAVVYLVWYVLAGHVSYRLHASLQATVLAVPGFVFYGLTSASAAAIGSLAFGPVVLLGLAVWALRRSRLAHTPTAPVLMGLMGSAIFLFITAFGRDGRTEGGASNPRYVYVVVALLLPAAGLALSHLVGRRRGRLVVALALLTLIGISNFGLLLVMRSKFTYQSLATERQLIAAARIARVQTVIPGSLPTANLDAPDISVGVLRVFTRDGELPTGIHPTPLDVVNAAEQIQLGVTAAPLYRKGHAAFLSPSPGFVVRRTSKTCQSATSVSAAGHLQVFVTTRSAVSIEAPQSGRMTVVMTLHGQGGNGRRFYLFQGLEVWLDVAASDAYLTIQPPAGITFSTC